MASVAARVADQETVDRLRALVDRMDDLVDDQVTYEEHDQAFHDTVMRTSANRIARSVVQSLQTRVAHVAHYVDRTERALYVASNLGHRRIYEHIAAHDPGGAAEAMFAHITDAWLARSGGPDGRLRR
jgi:DNA-binding FadR family transcriptional regulator